MALDPSLSLGLGSSTGVSLTQLFGGVDGFWFDFVTGATGAGIASVSSSPPATGTASQGQGSAQPAWNVGGYANFDGVDDDLLSNVNPTNAVTLVLCGRFATPASLIVPLGSQGSTTGRVRIGILATGVLAGAVGATTETTITSGVNVGGSDFVALLRINGSAYDLQVNGVSKIAGTASGTPNTTVPFPIGANSVAGTIGAFAAGRIYRAAVIQRYMPDTLVLSAQRYAARGIVSI